MEFTLKNNGLNAAASKEVEEDVATLELEIKNLQDQLNLMNDSIDVINAEVTELKTKDTAIVASIDSLIVQGSLVEEKLNGLAGLVNTKKLTAETASIQEATISKANITELSTVKPLTSDIVNNDIKTKNITADKLTATDATLDNITATDVKVEGSLAISKLSTDEITANSIKSAAINTDNIIVNDKIIFNGIGIKSIDIKASGIDNMHLHKLVVKADGTLIIKLASSSIIVSANNVTSNYSGLYASYIENNEVVLYLSQDIDCQALVIGSATIKASTVLKTSVRRNADSNGNPNIENTVKVAVVDKLPVIGQRNLIYVVLGDCAYYCDGQYFYEMASKKRG